MIKGSDIESGGSGTRIKPMTINLGIALKDIHVDEKFVEITFVDPETRLIAIKRLWNPEGKFRNTNDEGVEETVAQAKDREIKLNLSHLTRLVELALGKTAKDNMAAEDYHSFIDVAITLLKPLYEKPLFNLKVTVDDNGYPVLGKYPSYIELHKEGVPSTLKFDPYELKVAAKSKQSGVASEKKPNPLGGLFNNVE